MLTNSWWNPKHSNYYRQVIIQMIANLFRFLICFLFPDIESLKMKVPLVRMTNLFLLLISNTYSLVDLDPVSIILLILYNHAIFFLMKIFHL